MLRSRGRWFRFGRRPRCERLPIACLLHCQHWLTCYLIGSRHYSISPIDRRSRQANCKCETSQTQSPYAPPGRREGDHSRRIKSATCKEAAHCIGTGFCAVLWVPSSDTYSLPDVVTSILAGGSEFPSSLNAMTSIPYSVPGLSPSRVASVSLPARSGPIIQFITLSVS